MRLTLAPDRSGQRLRRGFENSRRCRTRASSRLRQWLRLVISTSLPQGKQCHGQFACYRDYRALFCRLSAASGDPLTRCTQRTRRAKRPEYIVGTVDQEAAQLHVASLGDSQLFVALPRLVAARHQAEIRADGASVLEVLWVFQGQNEAKCRERTDSRDLPQPLRRRISTLPPSRQRSRDTDAGRLLDRWSSRSCCKWDST